MQRQRAGAGGGDGEGGSGGEISKQRGDRSGLLLLGATARVEQLVEEAEEAAAVGVGQDEEGEEEAGGDGEVSGLDIVGGPYGGEAARFAIGTSN